MSKLDLSFYEELHKRVAQWNCRVGNEIPSELPSQCFALLENQAKRVVEEANEILDGAAKRDVNEILDGIVDTLFTLTYAVEIARKMGYDVAGACKAVCDENDTKLSDNYNLVKEEVDKLNEQFGENYCRMSKTVGAKQAFYCIKRNSDGKVLKFSTHKKVDLNDFIPNGY